jgi:hypothetical protein
MCKDFSAVREFFVKFVKNAVFVYFHYQNHRAAFLPISKRKSEMRKFPFGAEFAFNF